MKISQVRDTNLKKGGRWYGQKDAEGHYYRTGQILGMVGDVSVDSAAALAAVAKGISKMPVSASRKNRLVSTGRGLGFDLKYHKTNPKRRRILNDFEMNSINEAIEDAEDTLCAAVTIFLRDTGCRGLEELSRIDLDRHVVWGEHVTLISYKGGHSERLVPLSEAADKALRWLYYEASRVHADGRRLIEVPSRPRWYKFWNTVRVDKGNVPYDLRHTFCTRLFDKNIEPPAIMKIMGHKKLEQTMEYYHLSPKMFTKVSLALK